MEYVLFKYFETDKKKLIELLIQFKHKYLYQDYVNSKSIIYT